MPIRFPTDAANDPGMDNVSPGSGRARAAPAHHSRTGADSRTDDEATPGKGINQAGFIRERERDPNPEKE